MSDNHKMSESDNHISVLLNEVLSLLIPEGRTLTRAVDGTLGAGGHTKALLDAGVDSVLGLDLDPQALALARATLESYGNRVHIAHASYLEMAAEAGRIGWTTGKNAGVDAILLDLGVSSMQLDTPERGFAFRHDGPLDMRFNPSGSRPPASDIVNSWDEGELATLFYRYGEDPDSRKIARAVVAGRPFTTTQQLADVIETALRKQKRGKNKRPGAKTIHPATRAFQALRIAVNDELKAVEHVIPIALALLRPGGRLAIISFHSLEDRIVKTAFKEASTEIVSPPGMVLPEKQAVVKLITRKPVTATENEAAHNPRSRSAKLRVIEKL